MTKHIKVLGTGCPNCKTLEKMTRDIVNTHNIDAIVTKEEDIVKIMKHGVMRTPAIVINEKVVLSGRLPNISELTELLIK